METKNTALLIGNSYPISLIRREVVIYSINQKDVFSLIENYSEVISFWGHDNTLCAVNKFLGIDITPAEKRLVISLTSKRLPYLQGMEFDKILIISPVYKENIRPEIGTEVASEMILNWEFKIIEFSGN